MLGNAVRRSLEAAAEEQRESKVLGDEMDFPRQMAAQTLMAARSSTDTRYRKMEEGSSKPPPSEQRYEIKDEYDDNQLALAAAMMAADLVRAAEIDHPAVYQDLA